MARTELDHARALWKALQLPNAFYPVRRFGNPSAYGKIYISNNNKLMKITAWTKNSQREMKISKIASNKNIGPKVYHTRTWSPRARNAHEYATLRTFAPKGTKLSIITMNLIPRSQSVYNAINNGVITNFKPIENMVKRMHAAGIHHGNLHGGNILVYVNNSGQLKFVPIDFGASKYHPKITNTASAVRRATQMCGFRGPGKKSVIQGFTCYARPGREQLVRSNQNMLNNLRHYFNTRNGSTTTS